MCFCCHETEALLSKILKPISLSLVTAELYINKGVFDCSFYQSFMTDCVIRIQNKAKLLSVNSWWPLNRGELIGTAERSTRALNRGLISNILDLFHDGDLIQYSFFFFNAVRSL